MNSFRIALANLRFPATPEESVALAERAIAQAAVEGAAIVCFPECFVPGYRGMGKIVPPPDVPSWRVPGGRLAPLRRKPISP
jgi:predicted amidohydrolase